MYLKEREAFKDLWQVRKLVMTLSYSNASSESIFSIKKDIFVENHHETTHIALHTTYDAVKSYGEPLAVKISLEMIKSTNMSRSLYFNALEQKN